MTSIRLILAALLTTTFGAGLAYADDDDWAGFYKAIDAADGSVDRLSIVPKGDGTFVIRLTADRHGLCADTAGSGAGWATATGTVVDGNLVRREVMVMCDGEAEARPMADATYTRDGDTDILTLELPGHGRVQYYHRISDD
ncbi:MAG: hypothetical protein GY798_24260 [Hyphomicrobiales bacterium]|nr:hypothetical protein [Hyphomicrobiales bacterium]